MIRSAVAASLLDAYADGGYVFPAYDSYCFARVPATLAAVLGVDIGPVLPGDVFDGVTTAVDCVVHVLLDGFGFDQWQQHADGRRFLSAITDSGPVTPLTSIYPSETAAAITTLHTARSPADHGLLGWYGYYEEFDAVLQTLPFATLDGTPAADAFHGADPRVLFDGDSVYERLADSGVESIAIQPEETVGTPYTALSTAGAKRRGYDGHAALANSLRAAIKDVARPGLVYGYVPDIDAIAHETGPGSPAYNDVVASIDGALWQAFTEIPNEVADRTLLVVTADHGHIDTVPAEHIDLRDYAIWDDLQEDGTGDPIPPTGGGRNVHLHVKPGRVAAVRAELDALDARVFTRDEAINEGLFGPGGYGSVFRRRCGDLVIVHRETAVWYRDHQLSWIGHHGGLSQPEMLVPFAVTGVHALTG